MLPTKGLEVTCPLGFRWCSSGATRNNIKKELATKVPAIDVFRNIASEDRANAYVLWMDRQADLILHPELRTERLPPDIHKICLNGVELEGWRTDFQEGTPSDWSSQAFGTSEFMDTVANGVVERQRAIARKRYLAKKSRPGSVGKTPPRSHV